MDESNESLIRHTKEQIRNHIKTWADQAVSYSLSHARARFENSQLDASPEARRFVYLYRFLRNDGMAHKEAAEIVLRFYGRSDVIAGSDLLEIKNAEDKLWYDVYAEAVKTTTPTAEELVNG